MTLTCSKCKETKTTDLFHKNKAKVTGFHNHCKSCRKGVDLDRKKAHYYNNKEEYNKRHKQWIEDNREQYNEYMRFYNKENIDYSTPENRSRRAKYRALLQQAMPEWSNQEYLKRIYVLCKEISEKYNTPFEVDHIHPLGGENFTGLHVWFNLMIVPRAYNRSKGNKLFKNKISPRVSDNFDDYLSELKMYAGLMLNQA